MDKPEYFSSVKLLVGVYILMSTYHYRITARRYIYDLFEGVELTRETILKIEDYLKNSLNVSPKKPFADVPQITVSSSDLIDITKLKQEERNEKTASLVSAYSVENVSSVTKQVLKPLHTQIGFFT